jgi:hypothetical protein
MTGPPPEVPGTGGDAPETPRSSLKWLTVWVPVMAAAYTMRVRNYGETWRLAVTVAACITGVFTVVVLTAWALERQDAKRGPSRHP